MIETKYIDKDNAQVILNFLNNCQKENKNIYFKVYDTEAFVVKTANPEKVIEEMDGGDEIFTVQCFDENKNRLGWFDLLPYEETDCIIADFAANNEFCEKVANM